MGLIIATLYWTPSRPSVDNKLKAELALLTKQYGFSAHMNAYPVYIPKGKQSFQAEYGGGLRNIWTSLKNKKEQMEQFARSAEQLLKSRGATGIGYDVTALPM